MAQGVNLVTGANAKLKINGKTLGYATGVNLSTRVDMVSGETMGRYEVASNEPIAYSTNGSFTMLRYTSAAVGNLPAISTVGNSNGIDSIGLSSHVNPSTLLNSATFDVEIYQKTSDPTAPKQIFKVQNCRITSRSGGVNKRGIYEEAFNFVGILSEDDRAGKVTPSGLTGANVV